MVIPNILASRYASAEMKELWSPEHKVVLERRLWIAVLRAQKDLGVDVPDDTHGVLQDIHWSQGGIGYFPTYALGNVISLQIWAAVREAIPDLDSQMEAGELHELAAWLRDNLYSHGRKFRPKETIERITGTAAIDPQPYLAYLRDKLAMLPAGV